MATRTYTGALTLEIDPERWAAEFGEEVTPREVAAYVVELLGKSSRGGASGAMVLTAVNVA